jgi:hypothetical protein
VGDLLFVRNGACILGPRAVGVGPGGSLCSRGGAGGCVVSAKRKASRAASPPRMVRICIGPCGEGANCTLHLVFGGRRSVVLGLPLGRLVAIAACMRGVGNPASRMVISVMIKPRACVFGSLGGGSPLGPIGQESLPQSGSHVVFDTTGGASFLDKIDARVFASGVAASERLYCGACFAF